MTLRDFGHEVRFLDFFIEVSYCLRVKFNQLIKIDNLFVG